MLNLNICFSVYYSHRHNTQTLHGISRQYFGIRHVAWSVYLVGCKILSSQNTLFLQSFNRSHLHNAQQLKGQTKFELLTFRGDEFIRRVIICKHFLLKLLCRSGKNYSFKNHCTYQVRGKDNKKNKLLIRNNGLNPLAIVLTIWKIVANPCLTFLHVKSFRHRYLMFCKSGNYTRPDNILEARMCLFQTIFTIFLHQHVYERIEDWLGRR